MNDTDVIQSGTATDQPAVEPVPPKPVDELSSPPPADPPPPVPPAPPTEPVPEPPVDPDPEPTPEPPPETPPPTIEDHVNGIYRDIVAGFHALANEPRYAYLRTLALSIEDKLSRIEVIIHPPEKPVG